MEARGHEDRAGAGAGIVRRHPVLTGLAVIVFAGVAAWFGLLFGQRARLAAANEALRAAGRPVTPAELRGEAVPEGQNAAPLLLELARRIDALEAAAGADLERVVRWGEGVAKAGGAAAVGVAGEAAETGAGDGAAEEEAALAALRTPAFREVIDLALAAGERPRCDEGIDYGAGFAWIESYAFRAVRTSVRILRADVRRAAQEGDTDGAVRALRACFGHGRHAAEGKGFIGWLASMAVIGMATDALSEVVARGDLGGTDLEVLASDLERLREEMPRWAGRAVDAERIMACMAYAGAPGEVGAEGMLFGREVPARLWRAAVLVGRPLLEMDVAAYVELMGRVAVLLEADGTAAAFAAQVPTAEEVGGVFGWSRDVAEAVPRLVRSWHGAISRVDVAVLGLALERHRREHGAYPESLEELDSAGLPGRDMHRDAPYVYRRLPDGVLVYGVGPDEDDDGGVPLGTEGRPYDDGDIVWRVERREGP